MKNYSIEQRACELAHYIVDSKDTVRGAANLLPHSFIGLKIKREGKEIKYLI